MTATSTRGGITRESDCTVSCFSRGSSVPDVSHVSCAPCSRSRVHSPDTQFFIHTRRPTCVYHDSGWSHCLSLGHRLSCTEEPLIEKDIFVMGAGTVVSL